MFQRVVIGITILGSIFLFSCGSGDNGPTGTGSTGSTPQQILAKNVLLTPAHASSAEKSGIKKEIDTTVTVSADNVLIDTAGNSLSSTNLQDALDNEIAINLSKMLPGSRWNITNKSALAHYKNTTGKITFSTDTLTFEGKFASAGLDSTEVSPCVPVASPVSYEMISESILYVTWVDGCGGGRDSVIIVAARNKNSLTLASASGLGTGISILTKIE